MASRVFDELPEEIVYLLKQEQYVTVSTINQKNSTPDIHAVSWVYASSSRMLRFAVDARASVMKNLRASPGMAMTVIGGGTTYSIAGRGKILTTEVNGISFPLAIIEVEVVEVKDVMFYGSRMISGPVFEKTYDLEAADELDNKVLEAMKKTQ
ncbi:pyridoxamine 5'-phosphate oxidase family protein [Marinococcus halophilus]|uniref:pyridoxamine 5'-phosphate oxidase family protein n=1 Tax=Marinococcus halophilus TaxID=1371 RepID=UPI0009A56FAF|nr:pyridoxamine 5'-phosphate oxidase family protein [Marinococcus halophilus]